MGWFTKDKKKQADSEEQKSEEKKEEQEQQISKEEQQKVAKEKKKADELKKVEEKKASELKKAEEKKLEQFKKEEEKKQLKQVNSKIQPPPLPPQAERQQRTLIKDEDVWIYESILQFMVSPTFLIPLGDFAEQKCIFFQSQDDPSPPSYREFHNEYKAIVNELIFSMSQEIGVQSSKVMELIEMGLNINSQKNYFYQMLVYFHLDEFIKGMAYKNYQIQQQAMQNLRQQGNIVYQDNNVYQLKRAMENSLRLNSGDGADSELQKAIKESQKEFENKQIIQDKEGEMLSNAIKLSKGQIEEDQEGIKRHAAHSKSQKLSKPVQKLKEDDEDELINIDDSDEDDNLYVDSKKQFNKQ